MLNLITIQGRLVATPELKVSSNGKEYIHFTVACNDKYGENEKHLFVDCTAFNGTAKFISQYFTKGQQILLSGSLWTDEYEAEDGTKRRINYILVNTVNFCGDKKSEPEVPKAEGKEEIDDFNLPF